MQHLSANAEARTNFSKFQDTFLCVLDSHAPMKKKCIRADEALYMTKHLRKAIMMQSRLENKYFKSRSLSDRDIFKKQKNYAIDCVKKKGKTIITIST